MKRLPFVQQVAHRSRKKTTESPRFLRASLQRVSTDAFTAFAADKREHRTEPRKHVDGTAVRARGATDRISLRKSSHNQLSCDSFAYYRPPWETSNSASCRSPGSSSKG